MKQKSQSLFSAIVARIANKFKVVPEKGQIIVEGIKTPNDGRTGIMIENETAVAVEDAPAVVDGPVEVRTRKGKKGPGTLIIVVPNKADAETVVETLKAEVEDGTMVFTSDHEPRLIITAAEWLDAREAITQRNRDRKALIESLTPDQLALLNIK